MKKLIPWLSLFLTLLLLAPAFLLTVQGSNEDNIKNNNTAEIKAFTPNEGDKSFHSVDPTSVYGVRMNVGAPFVGFAFCMPTNGSRQGCGATLSCYAWDSNYETTVAASPLVSEDLTNLRDCATNWIKFDELPAGEYLFTIENTVVSAGTWLHTAQPYPAKVYNNGTASEGTLELTIRFSKTPYTPFFELSEDVDYYGDHVTPERYVIPEDSLIRTHEVLPDTWVFTDSLGRTALTYHDVGGLREDKTIAMFYSDWHVDLAGGEPFNNNSFILEHPEAINDYNHSGWPKGSAAYFWNEPLWGYYRTDDAWVLRRQAELLADAGVDVIFNDNTNGNYTWRSSYIPIYETWSQAMKDGVRAPKVSYLLPFGPTAGNKEQVTSIYLDIFRQDRYPELWFWWDDKPLLMVFSDNFNSKSGLDTEIKKFFSWRPGQPSYLYDSKGGIGIWGWLSAYPQVSYYARSRDVRSGPVEQITVGVAQNFSYTDRVCTAMNGTNITGRSYTTSGYHTEENAVLYGYNFSEQFDYALEVDPRVIFVTGWNEWTAGRQQEWGGVKNAFADQFNDEFSRDIEPTKGALKDNYYYLLVNYVRRYKGCHELPVPSLKATVDMTQPVNTAWADVGPYYAAYIGNTGDRDAQGYGSTHYSDFSGRNDLIGAKVARDDEYVYFLAECAADVTPYTDPLWMNLYIDTDADGRYNGWESFDYVIGKTPAAADHVTLEKFTGTGYETVKVADCAYTVDGHYLQIRVAKADLGLAGDDFTINFAWTDNVHDASDTGTEKDGGHVYTSFTGDIMDFYTSGDAAPGGRFKFTYVSTRENATGKTADDTQSETLPETEAPTAAPTDTQAGTEAGTAPAKSGCKSCASLTVLPLLIAAAWTCGQRRRKQS